MEAEEARKTDAFREKQHHSLIFKRIYLKHRTAAITFIVTVVALFSILSFILIATEQKNLPNLSKTQTSNSSNSGALKSSAACNSKTFIKSSTLTLEQKEQVDEIVIIVRSNTTKFNDGELSEALKGKNDLLEVVITECTKNTPENGTVSGEAILKLMMCADNTESWTDFGLHLKSTIFKVNDSFDKPAENFWNLNLDDATSDIPPSDRAKIVDKVSEIIVMNPLTRFACDNLVDSFAKIKAPPFTGLLWYEYVVMNFKAEGSELHTLLEKLDKAVDAKDPFLQIDEVFEKIQEKNMFHYFWSNRVANSFMNYLIRKGKVKQSHLLAYMKNMPDANEKETRFSIICTLITDLDIYQKILNEIKFGYGTSCTSIPIFDTEILLKDSNFNIKLELLCNTLVKLKFDAMLKHSIEKLNPFGLLLLGKHPKFVLKEFPQTCAYIFKICSEDSSNASCFLYETSNENRLEFLKNTTLTDYSEIITISTLNDEMLKTIDEKGKYDKIKEYKVNSPEFDEILKLGSKHEMPNLSSVILSNIGNATDEDVENVSMDNKKMICDMFINVQTNDEQRSKNIEILMKKNVISSSFSFPTDISSNCQQTIITNATENNINNVLLANAKSDKIFDSLINSAHLKDVTPLVISSNFSDKQLRDLDAKNRYMNIPDPNSKDFETLLETGENKSLSNLMTKLDEVLKTTDISEIENNYILKYVFSKSDFTEQLKKLTADQLIKISGNYSNAIEECPEDVFTDKNVSPLIDHFTKVGSSVHCQKVVDKSKTISFDDCTKILGKFTTNSTLAMTAVGKCNFTDYDQVKNVRDLCDKNSFFTYALNTLFSRKAMWKPSWICAEFQQSDAAKYYHYSMPVLLDNVDNFTDDQWKALPSLNGSNALGSFNNFTPIVFQKIAEKNQGLLVEILNRLQSLTNPESFLLLLRDNEFNVGITTLLKKLILKDHAIYESILKKSDFDNYKDILKSVLQEIKETSKSLFLNDDTLKLIEDKYDTEFYCDMVYCTIDLKYDTIPQDKLIFVLKRAPNEEALEKFLLHYKSLKTLDNIFYNQTFDETIDANFLELLKTTTSNTDSSTYKHVCGKRIEHATGGNDPFFEYFCPGKNNLITSYFDYFTYFSLIDKALKKFDVATVSKPLGQIHKNDLNSDKILRITRSIFNIFNNDLAYVALLSLRKCTFLKDLSELKKWIDYCLSDAYNTSYKTKYLPLKPTLVALCTEINKSALADLIKSSPFNQEHYMKYCELGSKCDNEIFTQLCPVLPNENVMQWLKPVMYNMIETFMKSKHQHLETILSNVEVALGKTLLPENIKVDTYGDYVDESKDYNLYSKMYFTMGANQNDKNNVKRDIMIMSHLCVMSLGVKSMLINPSTANEKIFDKVFDKLKNDTSRAWENLLNGIEVSFKNELKNLDASDWTDFAVKHGNDVFKSFCPIEQVKKYKYSFKSWYNSVKDDKEIMKLEHISDVKKTLGIK